MNKKIKFLLIINLFIFSFIYYKLFFCFYIEKFNNNCYLTNNKYDYDECKRNHLYEHMKISLGNIL
jgi:hypothetical protein